MGRAKQSDLKPLLQALQELNCDGSLKSKAFYFLRLDMSRLHRDQDFRDAWAGLLCAQQLLGPLHGSYLKTLDSMAKALKAYWKAHADEMTPVEWVTAIEGLWKEWSQIFKRHCPGEVWEEFGQKTERLFRGLRK